MVTNFLTCSNVLSWIKYILILINISLRFGLIDNIEALVQIMASRSPCYEALSEPMMLSLCDQCGSVGPRH